MAAVTCTFQLDARIKHMDPKWPRGCLGRFRIPGVQLLEIPYDPTTLSNEHAERINALDSQIAEKAGAFFGTKKGRDWEGLWRDLTWDENQQIQIDPAQDSIRFGFHQIPVDFVAPKPSTSIFQVPSFQELSLEKSGRSLPRSFSLTPSFDFDQLPKGQSSEAKTQAGNHGKMMERWWNSLKFFGEPQDPLIQKPHVPQIDVLIHRGAQENSQAYPLSLHHPPWYDEICSGKLYKWWKATVDVCKALWFWLCHCCVRRIPRASSLRSSLFSKIGQYEAFVAFHASCSEVLDRCWLHCESLPHCGLNFGLNSDHVDMNHMFLICALHCILVFSWFGQYFPRSTNIIKEIGCGKDRDTGQGHRSDSCPNPRPSELSQDDFQVASTN